MTKTMENTQNNNQQYTLPLIDLLGNKLIFVERYPKNYGGSNTNSRRVDELVDSTWKVSFNNQLFERRFEKI